MYSDGGTKEQRKKESESERHEPNTVNGRSINVCSFFLFSSPVPYQLSGGFVDGPMYTCLKLNFCIDDMKERRMKNDKMVKIKIKIKMNR